MEKELNIAEILKNKQKGISLYSSVFGDCIYRGNYDNCIDVVTDDHYYFNEKGHYITNGVKSENGECLLFPSKNMRDWKKFTWKRGDVLIRTNSEYCMGIFDEWTSDDYSTFSAKYINLGLSDYFSCSYTCKTEEWEKAKNSKIYISEIECVMNGKLNLQTLKIQIQSEFNDVDGEG